MTSIEILYTLLLNTRIELEYENHTESTIIRRLKIILYDYRVPINNIDTMLAEFYNYYNIDVSLQEIQNENVFNRYISIPVNIVNINNQANNDIMIQDNEDDDDDIVRGDDDDDERDSLDDVNELNDDDIMDNIPEHNLPPPLYHFMDINPLQPINVGGASNINNLNLLNQADMNIYNNQMNQPVINIINNMINDIERQQRENNIISQVMNIMDNMNNMNNMNNDIVQLFPNNNDILNRLFNVPLPNMENVSVTLSDEDMNKLNIIKLDENMDYDCSICLEHLEKENVVIKLKCDHCFHKECIENYLKNYSYKCPVCRTEAGKSKYTI